MCTDPITLQGDVQVACRKCNACLNARKNDWVARAVAETNQQKWGGVFNLTYENEGRAADGGRAFRYKDVQDWLKRLREAVAERNDGIRPEFKYMICGERGSDKGRVHWHCLVWCEQNLFAYGDWADFRHQWRAGFLPSDGPRPEFKIQPEPDPDHRKVWSMWPHGHVTIDNMTEASIVYATKYILKDQFNEVNSKGTARFTKSNRHGASFFRMSKKPPIGETWLLDQLDRWEQRGAVSPTLQLKVPGLTGFWWPVKRMREVLLDGLRDINERIRERTGKDAPQWSTLLSTVDPVTNEKDYNRLLGIEEQEEQISAQELEDEIKREQHLRWWAQRRSQIRKQCGCVRICGPCERGITDEVKAQYRDWQKALSEKAGISRTQYETQQEYWGALGKYWREHGRQANPFCGLREAHARKDAFAVYNRPTGETQIARAKTQGESEFVGKNAQ